MDKNFDKKAYKAEYDSISLSQSQKDTIKRKMALANETSEKSYKSAFEFTWARAVAAVVAVALLCGSVYGLGLFSKSSTDISHDNSFVLKVNAAEISKDNNVAFNTRKDGCCIGELENGTLLYSMELPFYFEGTNIETINYTASHGLLTAGSDDETYLPPEKKIFSDDYLFTTASYNAKSYLYKSMTIKYDKQPDIYTKQTNTPNRKLLISATGKITQLSKKSQEYLKNHSYELLNENNDVNLFDEQKALDALIDDLVITARVTFKDGTTETKKIKIGTKATEMEETDLNTGITYKHGRGDIDITYTLIK